jgi:hypothetical protein
MPYKRSLNIEQQLSATPYPFRITRDLPLRRLMSEEVAV